MKKIVVLTGAGISAESGIKTFRDSDGLWENYRIEDVATPQAWHANQELVLGFYNERRKQVMEAKPNAAHMALVDLEKMFDVHIITQNIDDLHERAGSKKVLHLHGEILKARSTVNASLVYALSEWEMKMGDRCERGSQLRPHIVWFGEDVPELMNAAQIVEGADILLVIGTSLQVYPAASLIHYAGVDTQCFLVDPHANEMRTSGFEMIAGKAGEKLPGLVKKIMEEMN